MKKASLFILIAFISCNQPADKSSALQSEIDSLKIILKNAYVPGFGEFMSSVQVHHAKLWFAGQNENWKLADFEIHEMMEAIDNIQRLETERPESKKVLLLNPTIDSVRNAIEQKNPILFKKSYVLLTNTCNDCHRAVNFEFNVVKIPETPPFSNQDFRVLKIEK
jgi:hypothetical protein